MKRAGLCLLVCWMVACLTPARAGADGMYLAGLGGAVVGVDQDGVVPGLALRAIHEHAGLGFGLELGYGTAPRTPRAPIAVPRDVVPWPSPTVTRESVFSLMASLKAGVENPTGEARLFVIVSAGAQDRVSRRSVGGDPIAASHDPRFGAAFGFGLEGTGRVAPTFELRASTIPEEHVSSMGFGALLGVAVRP
jgi:hypothetical protein